MSARVCNNCGKPVSEYARFCAGCGNDLQQESKPVITPKELEPKSPDVIKSAKKGFGIGAKIGLGIGVIFVLIIAVGVIVGSSNTEPTQSSSSNTLTPEQQAVNFVQNYRGPNGTGNSIVEVASDIVNLAYNGENIANNPSSDIGWMGLIHYDPNSNGNVWEIDFTIKTYRENTKIVWYVNMDTHAISPGDTTAKNILDMVNTSHSSINNSTLSQIHS